MKKKIRLRGGVFIYAFGTTQYPTSMKTLVALTACLETNRRTRSDTAGVAATQNSVSGGYLLPIEDIHGDDHFPDIESAVSSLTEQPKDGDWERPATAATVWK
jgi:hypothetical protein